MPIQSGELRYAAAHLVARLRLRRAQLVPSKSNFSCSSSLLTRLLRNCRVSEFLVSADIDLSPAAGLQCLRTNDESGRSQAQKEFVTALGPLPAAPNCQ